ncbi:MAG TPA: hypothetical protein VIJ07_20540, partial [Dermatophilaceae bacterium]
QPADLAPPDLLALGSTGRRAHLGEYLTDGVRRVLLAGGAVDRAEVVITPEPAWTPEMMADDTKQAFGW